MDIVKKETLNFVNEVKQRNENSSDIIDLNISGQTSMSVRRSLLPSKILHNPTIKDGKIFIDRDPVIFGYLISYLRNNYRIGEFDSRFERKQFKLELEYWGLINKVNEESPVFTELNTIFESQPILINDRVLNKWKKLGDIDFKALVHEKKLHLNPSLKVI